MSFVHFQTQMPILLIEGRDCARLRNLYKYLRYIKKSSVKHIHARLAVDEIHDIEQYLNRDILTLLLQPIAFNWNPYAVLVEVKWLEEFHQLQHLEISLNGDSAQKFVHLLRQKDILAKLQALVVSTNQICNGLWSSLTTRSRTCLRVLSTNNFRLQNVPLHHMQCLRFLWINRPGTRDSSYLATNLAKDVPSLKYLTTSDFRGLGSQLNQWMTTLCQNNILPELEFWEVHDSDIAKQDTALIVRHLAERQSRHPLTIQGLVMNERCIDVQPQGHRLLSCVARKIPLHKHRIYRSLHVLEYVIHTQIPTPCGNNCTMLRGKFV